MKSIMATQNQSMDSIPVHEVGGTMNRALFLDVRTPVEFDGEHIEGSALHPLSDLEPDAVKALAAGKSGVLVICRSGNRAKQAAEKLVAAGVDDVKVLDGGIMAWNAAGLPLVRGRAVMSLERQVRIAAGSLVFVGAMLGYFVNPAWIFLSGFVGAGLVFAGITDTCGMGMMLARMPWNTKLSGAGAGASCCSR